MRLLKVSMAALVGGSMMAAPVLAQTGSASSLSVASAQSRSGAEMAESDELWGGWTLPLIALIAIIIAIIVISGGDDGPTSP